MIKQILIRYFPSLGIYKRYFIAYWYCIMPTKTSYSQHGEDMYFDDLIKKYQVDKSKDLYVDIGSNHPVSISNTYLLYRNGYKGIAIDPNIELINLFKKFRKRDVAVAMGCSNENTILKFKISKTPVLSSFKAVHKNEVHHEYYCPIIRVDDLLKNIECRYVFLLSIDVEGLNHEVLTGAINSLSKVLILCIEYDDKEEEIKSFAENNGFRFLKNVSECNLIFINNELEKMLQK